MDSTPLVCVADDLKVGRAAELPALKAVKEHFEMEALACTDGGKRYCCRLCCRWFCRDYYRCFGCERIRRHVESFTGTLT